MVLNLCFAIRTPEYVEGQLTCYVSAAIKLFLKYMEFPDFVQRGNLKTRRQSILARVKASKAIANQVFPKFSPSTSALARA
jgi:hypothetical protein